MKIILKKLSEIKPYENNPRKNDTAAAKVAASIKEFGFKVPVVIDRNNVVITGHARIKAAELLGINEIPCIIADDLTPEQVTAFRLADNKVSEFSEWDFNKLSAELDMINIDMAQFGFKNNGNEFDINMDDLDESFSLPDGDKPEIEQMSFVLHHEQAELIKYAISLIEETPETFGNTNKHGNALYEVVRQWAAQRK